MRRVRGVACLSKVQAPADPRGETRVIAGGHGQRALILIAVFESEWVGLGLSGKSTFVGSCVFHEVRPSYVFRLSSMQRLVDRGPMSGWLFFTSHVPDLC